MRSDKRIGIAALRASPRLRQLSSALLLFVVACHVHAAAPATGRGADDSRIAVTTVAGDVDVTMAGQPADVAPEATLVLPARIVTGHDGTVGLAQAGTTISVANDTDVEIPAEAVDGNLIARLVQHSGNVFYDVAPRDLGKLRVETPFLVAVIKGTQFNVAVQGDSTTISLFEGSLEIRTPDNDDFVQLNAGEIAIRSLIDDTIRVVGMNDERVALPPRDAPPSVNDGVAAQAAPSEVSPGSSAAIANEGVAVASSDDANVASTKPAVASDRELVVEEIHSVAADVVAKADVDPPGRGLGLALDTRVDVGADVRLDAGVDLPSGKFEAGLGAVDVGKGGVEVGLGEVLDLGRDGAVGLDLGRGNVDVGAGVGLEVDTATVDVGLDVAVDVGDGAVDVELDVDADLGAGSVDLGLDSGLETDVDLGGADVDVGVDADLDRGHGLDTHIDAGLHLGTIDTSVDAGADLGTGSLDLALDVGLESDVGLDVGLDVDLDGGGLHLGLGRRDETPAPAPRPRGLLGGLL
jgi:hypothetical protein